MEAARRVLHDSAKHMDVAKGLLQRSVETAGALKTSVQCSLSNATNAAPVKNALKRSADGMGFARRFVLTGLVYALTAFYSVAVLAGAWLQWAKTILWFWLPKKFSAPRCLTGAGFKHGQLRLHSGLTVHYVETGEHHKPLMLCLHGFPEFWFSWRHQLRAFKNDYWVVAVDLRGYGGSGKPDGVENYTMDILVEDVRQTVQSLGRVKVNALLAHDWGALIGWNFVAKHPELVDRFVPMNGPHPTALRKYMRSSWRQFLKSWYVFFLQMPYLPEMYGRLQGMKFLDDAFTSLETKELILTLDELQAFKFTFSQPGALTPPINYYRALDLAGPIKALPRIVVPTCLIFGTADLAIEPVTAELSADYCDHFVLEKLEGVSHWVQQEAPEKVNEIVREFLRDD